MVAPSISSLEQGIGALFVWPTGAAILSAYQKISYVTEYGNVWEESHKEID